MRITNPEKPSQFISRQLHHFDGKFDSITAIKVHLIDKFGDQVPQTINFNIGYFEGRQSKKRWLCCQEDLNAMYQCYKEGGEISLWCDSRQLSIEQSKTSVRKRKQDHPTPTPKQEKEEQVDIVYRDLKEKHANKYDNLKLRLWARMIVGGLHESTDEPPAVPAFHCELKRRKDSLSGALTDAAGVLVKYMDRRGSEDLPNQSRVGVSPGKVVDLRMKNLQQLRYLQSLYEDNILSDQELAEQKQIVLESLRKLL